LQGQKPDSELYKQVARLGAKDMETCMQCGNCAAACPLSQGENTFPRKIYRYLSPSHAAYNTINEYFRANSPFERLQTERVRVKIESIVPLNQDTYQIDWQEIVSDPRGLQLRVDHFKASATILLTPPSNEQEIIKNPIGLYVKEFNFSKVIQ